MYKQEHWCMELQMRSAESTVLCTAFSFTKVQLYLTSHFVSGRYVKNNNPHIFSGEHVHPFVWLLHGQNLQQHLNQFAPISHAETQAKPAPVVFVSDPLGTQCLASLALCRKLFGEKKKAKKIDFNSFQATAVQQYFHHIQAQLLYFIFNNKCKISFKNLYYLTGSV